jgi:hypothetical protein
VQRECSVHASGFKLASCICNASSTIAARGAAPAAAAAMVSSVLRADSCTAWCMQYCDSFESDTCYTSEWHFG